MPVLRVSGLSKAFGANQAVRNVSFSIQAGEILALIGPNGAGKTTTFNMINGQLAVGSGEVSLNGKSLLGLSPDRIARQGVGRTFQVAETFGSLTALQNVQAALLAHHRKIFNLGSRAGELYVQQALDLLEQVGMQNQAQRLCKLLAYGDVKRVELAMALAAEPQLLLMDEPTAGMAPTERLALMELVARLAKQRSMAVLFTEHSMDVVFEHADRIVVMARGELIAQGAPHDVRENARVQEVYFGAAIPPSGEVEAAAGNIVDLSDYGRKKSGQSLQTRPQTVLKVSQLNAWYGAAQILFDVNLDLARGEVVALMGRNGAGKSTTLKSLIGLEARRTGQIQFLGQDLQNLPTHKIARMGLGYVPEERRIFTDLSVLENLQCAQQAARVWPDGEPAPAWSIPLLFDYFPNLASMGQRRGNQMSGGEQQMLAVARTLMGNPYVILLDEPSEGVAPIIVQSMIGMIRRLKERGVSILLSEQNMEFASQVADRAYILEKGQIQYEGSMQALQQDHLVQKSFLAV